MTGLSPINTLGVNPIADIFVNAERNQSNEKTLNALRETIELNPLRKTVELNPLPRNEEEGVQKPALSQEDVQKVAQDFEAVFLNEMLKSLVPKPEENPLFGGTDGDETFRGMMIDEYAKAISASGGIGIASNIQRDLLGEFTDVNKPRNYDVPISTSIGAYEKTQAASEGTDEPKQQGEAL